MKLVMTKQSLKVIVRGSKYGVWSYVVGKGLKGLAIGKMAGDNRSFLGLTIWFGKQLRSGSVDFEI